MSIATCRMTDKPIRVGFLIQNIGPSPSGVWTRLRDLVSALMAEPKIELFAAVTNDAERQLLGLATDRTFSTSPMSSARRVFSTSRIARAFVEEFDLDLLQVESMPIPHRATVPLSVSLHDLREFDIPAWQLRSLGELYRRILLPRQARNVGAILSLTAWMSHEIEHRLSIHNVHVVPPIAPKAVVPAGPSEQVARSANVDQPFVLTVGHLEPRKNIEVLIRASCGPEWPRGLGLVVAGADHGSLARLNQMAATSPTPIAFLGPISDADKWWLLERAAVVAVPSLIEGFGIVALEGILVGSPVLVADAAALPEVVGDSRAVLPPDDHEAWCRRIRDTVTDPLLRSSIVEKESSILQRHTEASVVADLLAIYQGLVGPVR